MPPKAKFTREDIVEAALCIVREKGIDALTARSLAEELGSSAQPIFTVFKNMEEVQVELKRTVKQVFNRYVRKAMEYTPAIKQVGVLMIRFASEEPKLFQLLFMWGRKESQNFTEHIGHLRQLTDMCLEDECVELIQKDYGVTLEEAQALFQQVLIFTFGIGVLCATKTCVFSEEEIEELLGREFISMLMYIKAGKLNERTLHPQKKEQ